MTFSKEDLPSLKKAYHNALRHFLDVFTYKGQEVVTTYAKYCIEYLEQSGDPVIDEELQTASRVSNSIEVLKQSTNDNLVIVNIPIDGKTSPVVCVKTENKLEPLFIGLNKSDIEQILKYTFP